MRKLVLLLLVVTFIVATTTPILKSFLPGFGPGVAYACDNEDQCDDQGDDNDDQ